MSGLAEKFAEELQDKYYAGLWGNTLLVDMLWQGNYDVVWPPNKQNYISPSWSWAAVNLTSAMSPQYRGKFFPVLAHIISVEVVSNDINPYGEVKNGMIAMQSALILLGI